MEVVLKESEGMSWALKNNETLNFGTEMLDERLRYQERGRLYVSMLVDKVFEL